MSSRFPTVQPLGTLTISAPGTTTLLSANCGPQQGGNSGTFVNPPSPGSAFSGISLQAPSQNVGNVYLLTRGSTFLGNPNNVVGIIQPGTNFALPYVPLANGFLPENFCLDTDTGGNVCYGYGIY
jgi:hypothetical protein